jgi:CBS domain-containing protein
MYSQRVNSLIDPRKLIAIAPELSVRDAACLLAECNAGAVVVIEQERLVGILTERDIAFRVVARDLDPQQTRVDAVMTRDPITIGPRDTYGSALLIMHERGFRHLPVVERGQVIGIVSARNALDPELEEFVFESRRRTAIRNEAGRI